jgi:hypothetical protein
MIVDLVSTGIIAGNIGTLFIISGFSTFLCLDVYFGEGTELFGTSDARVSIVLSRDRT